MKDTIFKHLNELYVLLEEDKELSDDAYEEVEHSLKEIERFLEAAYETSHSEKRLPIPGLPKVGGRKYEVYADFWFERLGEGYAPNVKFVGSFDELSEAREALQEWGEYYESRKVVGEELTMEIRIRESRFSSQLVDKVVFYH